MSWANLDDQAHGHPKVRKLQRRPGGLEAFGVWTWCLSWCRAFSPTEGTIDTEEIGCQWNLETDRVTELVELLITVKLVDVIDDEGFISYRIHDWHDWQWTFQQRGGKARAATARRIGGRFAPADDQLDQQAGGAGNRAGDQLATPHPTSPHPTSARAGATDGLTEFRRRVPRPS